jgi:hypothetical protein
LEVFTDKDGLKMRRNVWRANAKMAKSAPSMAVAEKNPTTWQNLLL